MWPFKKKPKPIRHERSHCLHRGNEKKESNGGDKYFYCLHPDREDESHDYIEGVIRIFHSPCERWNQRGLCELFEKKKAESKAEETKEGE